MQCDQRADSTDDAFEPVASHADSLQMRVWEGKLALSVGWMDAVPLHGCVKLTLRRCVARPQLGSLVLFPFLVMRAVRPLLFLCACLLLSSHVFAFSPAHRRELNAEQVAIEAAADGKLTLPPEDCLSDNSCCKTDHSSTVWMCISTVLVLGMSPALALFEAGMLRSKSTVSVITQVIAGVITLSVMWSCIGFTLTFGKSQGGFIGSLEHAFFIDVSYSDCSVHAPYIPEALFAMFQMMFAVRENKDAGTARTSLLLFAWTLISPFSSFRCVSLCMCR